TGQGFNITIVAGGNLIPSGDAPEFPSFINQGAKVRVSGPSSTGGNITCNGCKLEATSTNGFDAGNVLIAPYSDELGDGGEINLDSIRNDGIVSSIDAKAADGGRAGNVTMIAPNLLVFNNVDMTGTVGAPRLSVTNAQPKGTLTADSLGRVGGSL